MKIPARCMVSVKEYNEEQISTVENLMIHHGWSIDNQDCSVYVNGKIIILNFVWNKEDTNYSSPDNLVFLRKV